MDHRRILDWADQHLDRLKGSTESFINKHPAVLVTKYDENTGENVVFLKVRELPIQDEWPFLVGDVLHNMRVALDYLTFQIVKPPESDTRLVKLTQFPICDDANEWNNMRKSRIGTLDDVIANDFQRLQPFHDTFAPRLEPLRVLNALENVHKHRHLLAAFPAVTSMGFLGSIDRFKITSQNMPFGPVEHDKEIYRYVYTDLTQAEKEVQFRLQLRVCFDKQGPAKGQIVVTALTDIRDHIRKVIFPALEKYV